MPDLRCDSPGTQERRDYVAVEAAAWSAKRHLDVPVTVISNDYGDAAFADPEQRANVEDQKGWLVLGSPAKQVVVSSGHDVPQLEPTLVADEVLAIVDQARRR